MKKVSCVDINPESSCSFEATGSNTKEAVNQMMDHIRSEHPDDVKGMSDADIRKKVEANVRSA
jgi:predicted small metal-binding protein